MNPRTRIGVLLLACVAFLMATWAISVFVIDAVPPVPRAPREPEPARVISTPTTIEVAEPASVATAPAPAPVVPAEPVAPVSAPAVASRAPAPAPAVSPIPPAAAPQVVEPTSAKVEAAVAPALDTTVPVDDAQAKAAQQRQSLARVAEVQRALATGDADGARTALLEAADHLGGQAGAELREAAQRLENKDLATARALIDAALLRAR